MSGAESSDTLAFLCHASEDKERVRALHRKLEADGVTCWYDQDSLLPGQDWDLEISRAIRNCRYVLACISTHSIGKRGYVQKELKKALDLADEQPEGSIYLIPVRLEPCDVPERLARLHRVDLFDQNGYQQLLRTLRPNRYSPPSDEDVLGAAAKIADVIVVGSFQVGKTALATRLLGVTEPALLHELNVVLRASRTRGYSTSPFPIRYRWSTSDDEWLFAPERISQGRPLKAAELQTELEMLHSQGDDPTSRFSDQPLEIGLPRRFAHPAARRDRLRVLDMPGLTARTAADKDAITSAVAQYSRSANLILFVESADKIVNALNDLTISSELFWALMMNPVASRIVATRAYTIPPLYNELARRAMFSNSIEGAAASFASHVRELLTRELSHDIRTTPSVGLERFICPVELGESLQYLASTHPKLAAMATEATTLVVNEISTLIDAPPS